MVPGVAEGVTIHIAVLRGVGAVGKHLAVRLAVATDLVRPVMNGTGGSSIGDRGGGLNLLLSYERCRSFHPIDLGLHRGCGFL